MEKVDYFIRRLLEAKLYCQLPSVVCFGIIVKPYCAFKPHKMDSAFKDISLIAEVEAIIGGVGAFFG